MVVVFCGVLVLVGIFDQRSRETLQFGSPELHFGGLALAAVVIVIGVFLGHAGATFWSRRLRLRLKNHHQRHVAESLRDQSATPIIISERARPTEPLGVSMSRMVASDGATSFNATGPT